MLVGPDPRRAPPTFCNVDQWCGSNANFVAIWGSSPFDIWIVAQRTGDISGSERLATVPDDRSALLHWDGIGWDAVQFEETRSLRSVWGSGPEDVWVVGDSAVVRHFDGKQWSPVHPPVGAPIDFTSVSGTSSNDVWVVGWGQTVLHFDGNGWSPVATPTWDTFRSVWASLHEVWVLGDKTLNRFDRTSWSTLARPPDSVQSSVWGRVDREAWVAGPAGGLERWDPSGEQTRQVVGAISANFRGLWGSSNYDGWAVGEKGAIAHWNGMDWSAGPHLTESSLNAAWGYQGTTWFVGDNGVFLEFDGQNYWASPVAGHALNRMWGSSAHDVWAVGRDFVHWDGSLWQDVARHGSDEALAVWGSSAADIWAGGAHGMLLRWDGARWGVETSPTNADIKGMWGSAKENVWAVDADGHFLHFDGSSWSIGAAPNFGPLDSVWGRNALDVIAVGGSHRIHFDGVNWELLPAHPIDTPTYRVAFGNGVFVWIGGHVVWQGYKAGGAYPELGRWDGIGIDENLEPTMAPQPISLASASIGAGWAADEKDVWISLGQLMHWDGATWSYAPGVEMVDALWGTTSDVWALTASGQIIRKSR